MEWMILGHKVCKDAFATLLGIGWHPRLDGILRSVMQEQNGPPLDLRFCQESIRVPSVARSEVCSYFDDLYDSVAEVLPETIDCLDHADSEEAASEIRHLPPGSLFELWRQYQSCTPEACKFKLFWKIYHDEYASKLHFRARHQHTLCTTCVKHKMLLKEMSRNCAARLRQRQLYDRHLKSQYMDRRVYWNARAVSRRHEGKITMILDGMDQAKFAWPRSAFLSAHQFDKFHRPRLHITTALVHGHGIFTFVSHADIKKSGSTTCEQLAIVFSKLAQSGVHLRETDLHLQLDNASGSNKNNTVLKWAASQVMSGNIRSVHVCFLRCGHTHEDIDALFSQLAAFLWKRQYLPTIESFINAIDVWQRKLHRPFEATRETIQIDIVRDWKEWLLSIGRHVGGIGGPKAPHVFEIERRNSDQERLCHPHI